MSSNSSHGNSKVPTVPHWVSERPFLNRTHLLPRNKPPPHSTTPAASASAAMVVAMRGMRAEQQERLLSEDVLNCLLGFEGVYIEAVQRASGRVEYRLDPDIDRPLRELVERILPIGQDYLLIAQYVEKYSNYEYGSVAQAFAAALDEVLQEYQILVAKLEDVCRGYGTDTDTHGGGGGGSLQKLWFLVQPAATQLAIIRRVCQEAEAMGRFGGGLLQHLFSAAHDLGGEPQTAALLELFLIKGSQPYFEMLAAWLYEGQLRDSNSEFLVEESPSYSNKERITTEYTDKYWQLRYTLRHDMFPSFLNQYGKKILTTGKYLNVIRECGQEVSNPEKHKFTFHANEALYGEKIDRAYEFACQRLLYLIMNEHQLLGRLRSLKHYFFMDRGDWFEHFLHSAEEELRRKVKDINVTKLESLLELSVRTATTGTADPFHESVSCELQQMTIANYLFRINRSAQAAAANPSAPPLPADPQPLGLNTMEGLDAFALTYKVEWPVSLVINKQALTKYQLLFRHLFSCKWVERQLCATWLATQSTKLLKNDRHAFGLCYGLRQRMLGFLQNLEHYMLLEVLEPYWCAMEARMEQAGNLDDVMLAHSDFLDTCVASCMLTNTRLFKMLTAILTACSNFAMWFPENFRARESGHGNWNPEAIAGDIKQAVAVFESNFDQNLGQLLDALNSLKIGSIDLQLKHLVQRLDYNGYYRANRFYQ